MRFCAVSTFRAYARDHSVAAARLRDPGQVNSSTTASVHSRCASAAQWLITRPPATPVALRLPKSSVMEDRCEMDFGYEARRAGRGFADGFGVAGVSRLYAGR